MNGGSSRRKRPSYRWGWSGAGAKMHAENPIQPRASFCGREITSGLSRVLREETPRRACALCLRETQR